MADPKLQRPFGPIALFTGSLRLFPRRPSLFLVFVAAGLLPIGVMYATGLADMAGVEITWPRRPGQPPPTGRQITAVLVNIVVDIVAYSIAYWFAVRTYVLVAVDHRADFGSTASLVLRQFFPLFAASILTVLAVMAGLVLLIVPGVILMLVLWLVTPCILVEGVGPIAAFGRSAGLTRGHRVSIFLFLLLHLAVVLGAVVAFVVLSLPVLMRAMQHPMDPPTTYAVVLNLASAAVQVVFSMWICAAVAYTYAHLRTLKEGPP
ncbi:MAG: hypothetical protein KDA64_00090 [Rhodospirillaceae bacterium]|nr:hypothetical protein [Rhodospirillaceae bacterium]